MSKRQPGLTIRRERLRVLLVGAGPHAIKVYWPLLLEHPLAKVTTIVELEAKRSKTEHLVGDGVVVVTTSPFAGSRLPAALRKRLDELVDARRIDAVIISTEPLVHEAYLKWAIGHGLPTLVDKPIIAYPGISNDAKVARRLVTSFDRLADQASARPEIVTAVAVQRRHHPGFELVREIVQEASARFGCPITAIQSTHSDGQFRHPFEVRDETYHGFGAGYGKLFHSGFHIVDVQAWLTIAAAEAANLEYDAIASMTGAARPDSFLRQVPRATYDRRWGTAWRANQSATDAELKSQMRNYGELDMAALTTMNSDGVPLTLSQITLLHTSFSRRSWPTSRPDLYKANGRVKHEHHNIVVGPFMTVQIHSYQAKDRHDHNDHNDYLIGGNNHFEINVFRNAAWWGGSVLPMETFSMGTIADHLGLSSADLVINQAKTSMLNEFIDCASGQMPATGHRSRLVDHRFGTLLLSTMAESCATGSVAIRHLSNKPKTRRAA